MSAKAAGLHQPNRIEPKLSDGVAMLDVDMGRLRSFQTVEEARSSASITWKYVLDTVAAMACDRKKAAAPLAPAAP